MISIYIQGFTKLVLHKMKIIEENKETNEVFDMLIDQMGEELYNHNLYRTFANYFKCKGLERMVEYYSKRAEEEMKHHLWIVDYLNANHAEFTYPKIDAVDEDFSDELSILELTLEVEEETTKAVCEILKAASECHDYKTVAWLNAEGMLIQEQIEEEHVSKTALAIAKQEDSWVSKEQAILEAYNKLN